MIGIIDYGMGNLGSVKRKLDRIGVPSIISETPETLKLCNRLILPGVGHFANAVKELRSRGLWDFLNEEVLAGGKPILGICLGMQLMARHSEEGDVEGLGWFDANVIRFRIRDRLKYKVPHIGWNQVTLHQPSPLFDGIDLTTGFYFVHAYHLSFDNRQPTTDNLLSETIYETPFISAVQRGNIYGVQFHPEKSHDPGKRLLRNFVKMERG